MNSLVKLPTHQHPLYLSARFYHGRCSGCNQDGYIYGGYRCNECSFEEILFHKECAESPPEINHPFHPQHPLILSFSGVSNCDLCGTRSDVFYKCSMCYFCDVDTSCARKPPQLVIEHPKSHEHTLVLTKGRSLPVPKCEVCKEDVWSKSYACLPCNVFTHLKCVDLSPEINHSSHTKHPLKLLKNRPPAYADGRCLLCASELKDMLHHCSLCNFSICMDCARNPPPLVVGHARTHEHQLTLTPRLISYTCDACGVLGDRSPYFCLQCNFMIHRECIGLPLVININRHDHRISRTSPLGLGDWKCGVCRQKVSQFHDVYSCSICPNYVVHLLCGTREDVWDGIDLDGMPEDTEDMAPFNVVGDNMISHFSHRKHNLILNEEGITLDEAIRCEACVLPIYSDLFYSCGQCDFLLHKTCAHLSRRKRHVLSNKQFTLRADDEDSIDQFLCDGCGELVSGFRYVSSGRGSSILDVRCALVCEPLTHESHPHPLYFTKKLPSECVRCGFSHGWHGFSCDDCDYCLHFTCAVIPTTVKHRYDPHPLSLCYGDADAASSTDTCWCDICEEEMDPKEWFYTCNECSGVTLHVDCVLGDFPRLMPGRMAVDLTLTFEVVHNKHMTRPFCYTCHSRCSTTFILKMHHAYKDIYICSRVCLSKLKMD